jgi:hypothetical protein
MLLWADGFDHYFDGGQMLNGAYAEINGFGGLTTTPASVRTGTKAYNMNSAMIRKVLPGSRTAVGVAFSMYPTALPNNNGFAGQQVAFKDIANAEQCFFQVLSTGHVRFGRNSGNVVLAQSAAPVIVANAHQHVEVYVEFSATVGKVKCRVNNVEVINVSNLNTLTTANVECSQIATHGGSMSWIKDDYYIYDTLGGFNDTYPIGDMQCLPLYPSADTAVADFTKSTGTDGKALIRDLNDATYLQSAAAGQKSEFDLDDLPANITYIAGLFVHNRIAKTDAGAAQMKTSILSAAAVAAGADRVMTTTPTFWGDAIEKDPNTNARWTRLAVNAAKIRLERTV